MTCKRWQKVTDRRCLKLMKSKFFGLFARMKCTDCDFQLNVLYGVLMCSAVFLQHVFRHMFQELSRDDGLKNLNPHQCSVLNAVVDIIKVFALYFFVLFETCRFLGKLFVLFNRLYFVKVSFLSISLSFAATTVVSACLLWRFIQTHESSQLPVIETLFPRRSVTSLLE